MAMCSNLDGLQIKRAQPGLTQKVKFRLKTAYFQLSFEQSTSQTRGRNKRPLEHMFFDFDYSV